MCLGVCAQLRECVRLRVHKHAACTPVWLVLSRRLLAKRWLLPGETGANGVSQVQSDAAAWWWCFHGFIVCGRGEGRQAGMRPTDRFPACSHYRAPERQCVCKQEVSGGRSPRADDKHQSPRGPPPQRHGRAFCTRLGHAPKWAGELTETVARAHMFTCSSPRASRRRGWSLPRGPTPPGPAPSGVPHGLGGDQVRWDHGHSAGTAPPGRCSLGPHHPELLFLQPRFGAKLLNEGPGTPTCLGPRATREAPLPGLWPVAGTGRDLQERDSPKSSCLHAWAPFSLRPRRQTRRGTWAGGRVSGLSPGRGRPPKDFSHGGVPDPEPRRGKRKRGCWEGRFMF